MTARCPLCEAPCPARFHVNGHAVHRCDACDLEFVWPTPPPEALRAVYERGYFTGAGAGYDDYFGRERDLAARKAATRLDALASVARRRPGRLVDVGCAAGYFVEAALARGWDAHGVEPSPEARQGMAPSVAPRVAASLDALDGDFDAVTFWDVLEHLPDPLAALRAARARLRPDGVMGVVVPVIGSVNTRLAPRTWDQYKPPEHLWFFSRRAVREALWKGAGLRVVREEVAWRRDARFVDPEGRARGAFVRLARGVDGALHRALASVWPDATVDSVAFYAR
ncbi:MAG: class I SAM-dependent methyltransferase [Polyangiales bacterium]